MIIYRKNSAIKTQGQAENLLKAMDDFIKYAQSEVGTGQPNLDPELLLIWNQGNPLKWQWENETQVEFDQRFKKEEAEKEEIEKFQADLNLWRNEKIRPIRNNLLDQWFDAVRSKPELWKEMSEAQQNEALTLRQTLLDWPEIFTEYKSDSEIENSKPEKPSYIN